MATKRRSSSEPRPGWVRSWDTDVTVSRSKEAFESLMRRYGATGLTVSEDYASRTVVVAFQLDPGGGREIVEVRLPLSYESVLVRLKKMPTFVAATSRKRSYEEREAWPRAQSERVAWRHLLLWAEAMLSSVDAGIYTLQEAVFAFTMFETTNGGKVPIIDAVNTMRRLGGGTK